jgi:hypothetical protein
VRFLSKTSSVTVSAPLNARWRRAICTERSRVSQRQASAPFDRATLLAKTVALVAALFEE